MSLLHVSATGSDVYRWVVEFVAGALALAVSLRISRRPAAMISRPRGGFTSEQIMRRTALFAAVGASPEVAAALAQGNRILAIKRYRQEHDARLAAAARAIDALVMDVVKRPLIAAGASPGVADALARGKRINAIKLYRQEQHVGLRDAAEAIERLVRAASARGTGET